MGGVNALGDIVVAGSAKASKTMVDDMEEARLEAELEVAETKVHHLMQMDPFHDYLIGLVEKRNLLCRELYKRHMERDFGRMEES